jgi:hypothetical protein
MLAPFPRLFVVRVVRSSSAPTIMYRRVLQIRKPQYASASLPFVAKDCVKACVPLTAPDGRDNLDALPELPRYLLLDLDAEGHLHVTRRQSRARLRSSSALSRRVAFNVTTLLTVQLLGIAHMNPSCSAHTYYWHGGLRLLCWLASPQR